MLFLSFTEKKQIYSIKVKIIEKWADDFFKVIWLLIVDFVSALVKKCNADGEKLAETVLLMEYRQAYGHMLVIELLC